MIVKKNQILNIILLLLFKAFLEVLYVKFVYEFNGDKNRKCYDNKIKNSLNETTVIQQNCIFR